MKVSLNMNKKYIFIFILIILFFSPLFISSYITRDTKSIYELKPSIGSHININNVDVYYELTGEKNWPYVVLIHGFGGNTSSWRNNVSTFHSLGYQTLAIDLPPFGYSQKSRYYNINQDNQAELVNKLLTKLDISKASFVGHSYGGGVALYFANKYPDKVEKIILVDSAINEKDKNRISFLTNFVKLPLISDYAKAIITILVTPQRAESILKSTYYNPDKVSNEQINAYLAYARTNDWQEGYLAMLTTPYTSTDINYEEINRTLGKMIYLIWGEKDTIVPLDKGQSLHTKLPSSKLQIIKDTGHLPMEESSDEFNSMIKTIFEKN